MSEESPFAIFEGVDSRKKLTLALVVLVFFGLLGLAIYGWITSAAESDIHLDILGLIAYVCDTVFGKEYILLGDHPQFPNWAVQISTYGFKLLFLLAVIKGGLILFGRKAGEWWYQNISKPSAHTVICGMGQRGSVLAKRLHGKGVRLAVIEIDEENPELEALSALGIHVVIGNALDEAVLCKARAGHAARVIALLPNGERNVSLASEVDRMGGAEVIAGVESYALRSLFRKMPRVRLVGFEARAARRILNDLACRVAIDPEARKLGVSLLIEAANPFRDELIRAASVFLQISGDTLPSITVTHASERDRREFEARYPDSFRVLRMKWHDGPADEVFLKDGTPAPDLAVFALHDDTATLDAAEQFRVRIGNRHGSKDAVMACIRDSDELLGLAKGTGGFAVCNLFERSLGDEDPLDDSSENVARELHEAYCRENPGQLPAWAELPEMVKDSNRLAAAHDAVKKAIWHSRGEESEDVIIEHLARCEHLRWMAEKVMDGWRWSGSPDKSSRDNSRLLHHLFVPYDQLSQEERDKDVTVVRKTLKLA